jgi:predicted O-methyltransferase YrrM
MECMSKEKWTAVDQYIAEQFIPPDPALESALQAASIAGLPAINVAPNQGKLLMLLARAMGARKVLEIGTLGGYSTIWLARALPADGRLFTLEFDPKHAEVATSNIARAGLARIVNIRVGRALDSLPHLIAEAPFDLIFIDADKTGYAGYFQWALKLARTGTLIVADNVVRDGKIIDAESSDENVQGIRRFNDAVAAEPRVMATAIQTVGSKGYDGLAFVLVTDE